MIVCLDMDCFFVSVERKYNPKLNHLPIIIAGNSNRSVVASCSYEARKYGIKAGMSRLAAQKKCPDIIRIPPNMARYQHASRQLHRHLYQYCPVVHPASIDEFYLDFSGCQRLYGPIETFAWQLKQHIETHHHLPCTIGISRYIKASKMACNLAKPNGMLCIQPKHESVFLGPLPVHLVPGIGHKTQQRLQERHIHTIRELSVYSASQKSPSAIHPNPYFQSETTLPKPRKTKQISSEITFETDTNHIHLLHKTLSKLTELLGHKLRQQKRYTENIGLKIKYANFQTHTKTQKIPRTACDKELYQYSQALLKKTYTQRMRIRCIGVLLTQLTSTYATSLFENTARQDAIYNVIDQTKQKYGPHAIQRGSSIP